MRGKYDGFITLSETAEHPAGRDLPWIAWLSGTEGLQNYYSLHWNMEKPAAPADAPRAVGHPPHKHKETELIFLCGTDPADPYDLGAEVEISFGPEMERHVIRRSCCIRIPPDTPHGFYNINWCTRPFLFIAVQEANPPTEKFLWEYLTREEIDSMPPEVRAFWQDKGYDD